MKVEMDLDVQAVIEFMQAHTRQQNGGSIGSRFTNRADTLGTPSAREGGCYGNCPRSS